MNSGFNTKISVVVPVYNTEKYVLRTLESLKAQTYSNIQIIIVNDCSPDNANMVIEKFIARNMALDVKYICFKKNRGLAAARKAAFQYIEGEYIHFLDSDDYILPNTYMEAIKKIEVSGADICYWGRTDVDEHNNVILKYEEKFHYISGTMRGVDVLKLKLKQWLWICTGNAIYSFELWKSLKPLFFEGLNMGEDLYSICKMLLYSNCVCCVEKSNFICMDHSVSMVGSRFSPVKLEVFKLMEKLYKDLNACKRFDKNVKEEIEDLLNLFWIDTMLSVLDSIYSSTKNEPLKKIVQLIKNCKLTCPKVKRSKVKEYFSNKRYIKYKLYRFNVVIFSFLMKLYHKYFIKDAYNC